MSDWVGPGLSVCLRVCCGSGRGDTDCGRGIFHVGAHCVAVILEVKTERASWQFFFLEVVGLREQEGYVDMAGGCLVTLHGVYNDNGFVLQEK